MRFSKDDKRIYMSVSELSAYAYQRQNPKILTDHYGFQKYVTTASGALSTGEAPFEQLDYGSENFVDPMREGVEKHRIFQADVVLSTETAHTEEEKNPQSPTAGIADAFIQNILESYLSKSGKS
jgi:protoporphyrinogen oxidase